MKPARRRVLVVDDDPDIFHLIHSVMSGSSELSRALSYGEAERHLLEQAVDAVVLDQNLGSERRGTDLLRMLRTDARFERVRDVPVIMLTADRGAESFEDTWDLGSTAYITKPFDVARLLEALDEVLPGGAD